MASNSGTDIFADQGSDIFGAQPQENKGSDIFAQRSTDIFEGHPQVLKQRDLYDVTLGAGAYGGSETAENLVKGIDRSWVPIPKADDFASSMQRFRNNHPEYAPIQVDNTLSLLSDPKALSSQLFSGASYLALQAGTSAIPIVGIPIAGASAYAIEAERAYEQAKKNGASEDDAVMAGRLTGSVNAGIQIMSDLRMFHTMRGDENLLSQAALRNTSSIVKALAPAARVGQEAVTMGSLAALQGAVNEGIALSTYDHPIDPGFIDRRLQEGVGGAVLAPFMAAIGKGYRTVFGSDTPAPVEKEVNVFDKNSAFHFFNERGLPEDTARAMSTIADSLASDYSVQSKLPKEKWYAQVINEENFTKKPQPSNGAALADTVGSIFDSFDKDPESGVNAFLHAAVQNLPLGRVTQIKDALKIDPATSPEDADFKMQTAFKRYLYDGEAPSPELAQPFADMRELLRDVYKTGASTGQKSLKPQQRAAFDALMAPETDEIVAARGKLAELDKAYREAFPKVKKEENPYAPSAEQLKGLLEPMVETRTRYDYPPDSDIPVAVDEAITRKRTPDEMKAEIDRITEANRQSDVARGNPDRTPVVQPPPEKEEISGLLRTKEEAASMVKNAYDELRRLQLGRLTPDSMSAVARRSLPDGFQRDALNQETPADTRQRQGMWDKFSGWVGDKTDSVLSGIDPLRGLFDMSAPLRRLPTGKKLLDMLSDQVSYARTIGGKYEERIVDTYRSLGWRERRWLRKEEVPGFTNLRRMLDTQGVVDHIENPPTPNLRNLRDLAWQINADMGHLAERHGVLMRSPMDGTTMPYEQPVEARMLRFPTEDTRVAMREGHGALWQAIVDAVMLHNKDIKGLKEADVRSALQNSFVDQEIKKNSALETARIFKIMPDIVYVNGKPIALFHTDALHYLRTAVRSQSQRIAMQRIFGQDLLDKVGGSHIKRIADLLGVKPEWNEATLRAQVQDRLFQNPPNDTMANTKKAYLQTEVARKNAVGVDEQGFVMSGRDDIPKDRLPDLIKQAKELGITIGLTKQDYIDAIQRVNADTLDAKGFKNLQKAARDIKGIDVKLPVHELLSEVKRRILEDPVNSIQTIVDKISREGGDSQTALDVIKSAQGIPLYHMKRNIFNRVLRTGSTLLGTSQTSESVLRNITQTPVLVPLFAGMKNYAKAVDTTLKHYNVTKSSIAGFGAIPLTHYSYGIEKGYAMESVGRIVRQAATTATGLKFIADMNNVIAGEAFRNLAEDWKRSSNLGHGDYATMKSLHLTDKEIGSIKSGQMSKETYAKIVQEGVALTQFVTQSGHLRGRIEHNPIAQIVLAYSNYAIGTGRAMSAYLRNDLFPAFFPKNNMGDVAGRKAGLIRAMTGVGTLLAGALGGGMASQILVSAWKGDQRKKMDEKVFDRMAGALFEIALIGPTQRGLDAFRYGSGENWFVGLMPQVKFVIDGVTAGINEYNKLTGKPLVATKTARNDFASTAGEAIKSNNPLLKDVMAWHDRVMYPEIGMYTEAKASSAKYIRDHKDVQGGVSDTPLDPLREKVFFYASRNDAKGAMFAAQEYYKNYFEEMKKDPKAALLEQKSLQSAMTGLHQSLIGRAPINLSDSRKMDFLSTIPLDRRQKYYQADMKYRAIANAVAPVGQ